MVALLDTALLANADCLVPVLLQSYVVTLTTEMAQDEVAAQQTPFVLILLESSFDLDMRA